MFKRTLNSTSPQKLKVQNGPSILSTAFPWASLTVNDGEQMLHSCSMFPITVPGGEVTSMLYYNKKKLLLASYTVKIYQPSNLKYELQIYDSKKICM